MVLDGGPVKYLVNLTAIDWLIDWFLCSKIRRVMIDNPPCMQRAFVSRHRHCVAWSHGSVYRRIHRTHLQPWECVSNAWSSSVPIIRRACIIIANESLRIVNYMRVCRTAFVLRCGRCSWFGCVLMRRGKKLEVRMGAKNLGGLDKSGDLQGRSPLAIAATIIPFHTIGQLSLSSLRGKSSTVPACIWLRLYRRGAFTCVRWQVTLCDPTWKVTPHSSEREFH